MGGLTLAIETSNPGSGPCEVGVGRVGADGGVAILAVETIEAKARHDDALMPAVAAACARAGVLPRDLARVAVSIGPGGYTAVRIAAAAAKMICEATGAACIGVPTAAVGLEGWRAAGGDSATPALIALASKNDTAWITSYPAGWSIAEGDPAGVLLDAAGLAGLLEQSAARVVIADEHLPEPMRAACGQAGATIAPLALTAAACLAASCGRGGGGADPATVNPLYPRVPDAVTLWEQRKAAR